MFNSNCQVIGKESQRINGRNFDIVTYIDPSQPQRISVEALENGQSVVVTFPDGYQATRSYTVDLITKMDMALGPLKMDAVDNLVRTAAQDLADFV
jgi:hypothetical protein